MADQDQRPRYLRIADELRTRITTGDLGEGDRLPSIPEMVRTYGVSDGVARQVVSTLVSEGLAITKPGSGTYVRARPRLRRMVRMWHRNMRGGSPFQAEAQNQGRTGTWDYDARTDQAPPAIRERLSLPETDEPDVIRTDYTFRADDEPVMLSTSWEPLALTRGTPIVIPEEGPYAGRGVVERMRQIDITVTHSAEVVSARPALTTEATALSIAPGAIVLTIERTYYADERPVETADIVIPVDRYQVVYGTSIWDTPEHHAANS